MIYKKGTVLKVEIKAYKTLKCDDYCYVELLHSITDKKTLMKCILIKTNNPRIFNCDDEKYMTLVCLESLERHGGIVVTKLTDNSKALKLLYMDK